MYSPSTEEARPSFDIYRKKSGYIQNLGYIQNRDSSRHLKKTELVPGGENWYPTGSTVENEHRAFSRDRNNRKL